MWRPRRNFGSFVIERTPGLRVTVVEACIPASPVTAVIADPNGSSTAGTAIEER